MNIHEYQGKELFNKYGVTVPRGRVANTPEEAEAAFQAIASAVAYARKKGLIVNAGHGLHYHNTERVAAIPGINELNIGHAIIARAVFTGLKDAVRDMKAILDQARGRA